MTTQPQLLNNFCNFDRATLVMLADAQRRLLDRRRRGRMPLDQRGEANLKRIESLLGNGDVYANATH